MRRLFDIFKNSSEKKSTEFPSLPFDLSYPELSYKTNRGFLARKVGQYLGLKGKEWDRLFYYSLTQTTFNEKNDLNDTEMILCLCDQMMNWTEQQVDILQQIKSLDISINLQNALLKAYEIHKNDLFASDSSNDGQINEIKNQGEQKEWVIYRDVMFASTQGKFLLITENEVDRYKEGTIICKGTIKESTDIPICRNSAKESLEKLGFSKSKVMGWLLVLSEAITNTIKHAEEGRMTLVKNEQLNEVHFIIEDKGPGFSLEDLPKKALLAGYSTKKSMGQGFTLMMKMAEQVLLFTSPKGSIIILIFDARNEKEGQINAAGQHP